MPEVRSTIGKPKRGSPDITDSQVGQEQLRDDTSAGPPSEPGWWSLAPSVSIAVFLIVAMFTLDSSGRSPVGIALIAGVVIGPLASYLLNTYWPRMSTEDRPAPRAPSPGTRP